MRYALIALSILLGTATPAMAEVSVSISIPGVSIGINQPEYPELVPVPGYPVYYAPQAQANYFFYDGLYWVYQDDRWYASSWYNGPWDYVEPDDVPLFVLRVPVRYYAHPPAYFSGWIVTAAPRWDVYWGPRWAQHRHGWDHWDRRVVYAPAPLPVYQRHYHGDRYPRREYQHVIRNEHYRYQPRDAVVRQHYQQRPAPRPQVHAQPQSHNRPAPHSPDIQREHRSQRDSEQAQRPQRDREDVQRSQGTREEVQRSQGTREEMRRSESQQRVPQQLQPPRQVQAPAQPSPVQHSPVQQAPQSRPDTPRPQRASREREQMQRTEPQQPVPQQRAPIQAQRAQPQPQRVQPQPQQAVEQRTPRPQQAQGPQGRGEASQARAGAEQRQGPRPDRGQERGRDRGQGRG